MSPKLKVKPGYYYIETVETDQFEAGEGTTSAHERRKYFIVVDHP
jgi:hypothetical protein